MNRETIARIAHEVNRAYCASQGDMSHVEWGKASEAQRAGILAGVDMHIANPKSSPQAQHEAWMAAKTADGWAYGEVKDEAAKTHPAMLPYDELPPQQRAKDFIFKMIVTQLSAIPDATPASAIAPERMSVKYIGHGGHRPTHKDGIYGTDLVWNYGQSILVPIKIAQVMLAKHPEVYAPGDATEDAPVVKDAKSEQDEEFQKLQDVRDSINAMRSKEAVAAYVKLNFRQDLAEGKLADMRAAAIQLVEQFGAP